MKELADAFNSMTSRFQEIRGDLDRQVCERIKQLIGQSGWPGIGFLAAGVAHEINNPLSAIAMAAESLVDRESGLAGTDPGETEIARQYLQMIDREAFRCQRITRKLLDFARGNGDTCALPRSDDDRERRAGSRPAHEPLQRSHGPLHANVALLSWRSTARKSSRS